MGPVELKRKRSSGARGGGRSRNCQRYVQAIVVTPLNKLPLSELSGPLDRLNAILSLLHPFDRYRTPSAIGSAIGGGGPISPNLASKHRWESTTASF